MKTLQDYNFSEKYGRMAEQLRERLDPARYRHSIRVAFTSAALAMRYESDVETAFLAGLLHDAAKHLRGKEYLDMAARFGLEISETERLAPGLLHGPLGAVLAEKEFGVTDPDILAAIRNHTTGRAGMSLLEKIVCIADYIEPFRRDLPHLAELRKEAFEDLDRTVYLYAKHQSDYLEKTGRPVDPRTAETRDYYAALTGEN